MSEESHKLSENERKQLEHQMRMRYDWDNLIEDMIEDGRQRGLFDDLPGKGKPLNLGPTWQERGNTLANKLLKDNDLKPAWMMHRDAIRDEIERLRVDILTTWTRYEQAFRFAQAPAHQDALVLGWEDACMRWEEWIVNLNRKIRDFNLKRPNDNLEIFHLRLTYELERIGAPRWLRNWNPGEKE